MSARLSQLAAALAAHGDMLTSSVDVAFDLRTVTLTVTVAGGLDSHELFMGLQRVRDLAQARVLCERYGIPPESLERFITGGGRG